MATSNILNGNRVRRRYQVEEPSLLCDTSYGYIHGMNNAPNESMRKRLADEWSVMSPTDRNVLRAQRAKRGIKCDKCNNVGYYTECCPNKCAFRPDSPDSMDSTPPTSPSEKPPDIATLWGDLGFGYKPEKADLDKVREQQKQQKFYLREEDAKLENYNFLMEGERGYTRTHAELNLHQYMRSMMRALEKQILSNQSKLENPIDDTLLHPPVKIPGENFFPEELSKKYPEYRKYYQAKIQAKESKVKAHMFKGNFKSEEALDNILRGGDTAKRKLLYESDPEAGKRSIHSKLGWKNILCNSDQLASSDPAMIAKDAEVKALFKQQGEWVMLQQHDMEQRNDRYEHFAHVLREEMSKEHARETKMLLAHDKKQERAERAKVWLEKLESVDRIIKTAKLYNISSGVEEVDYLLFSLSTWREDQLRAREDARERRIDLREQYERAGYPMPKKLWNKTNADIMHKMNNDNGNVTDMLDPNSLTADDKEVIIDKVGPPPKTQGPYNLQTIVPPPVHKKVIPKIKSLDGGGLAATAGGASPYELTLGDIMTHLLPRTKSLDELTKERKEKLQKELEEAAGAGMQYEGEEGHDDNGAVFEGDSTSLASSSIVTSNGTLGTDEARQHHHHHHHHHHHKEKVKSAVETGMNRSENKQYDDWVAPAPHVPFAHRWRDPGQRAKGKARGQRTQILREKDRAKRLAIARGEYQRAKDVKKKVKQLHMVYQPTEREKDLMEMKKVKKAFREAGMGQHIRDGGNDQANLHLMPALIPVPKTFDSNGLDAMNSYTAERIMEQTRMNLRNATSGYTKQAMLPLYVRNTLIEKNGTSLDGDQTQEVLKKDRRYNHTYGRSNAVFERTEGGALSVEDRKIRDLKKKGLWKNNSKPYKGKKHDEGMVTDALVRMAFKAEDHTRDY